MTRVLDLISPSQVSLLAWVVLLLTNGESASWRSADASVFAGSVAHDFAVDRARDAVVKLGVQLGQNIG